MLNPAIRSVALVVALSALVFSGCIPARNGQSDSKKDRNYLRGQSRVSERDFPGAITEFQRALANNPLSAPAHLELAFLFKDHGDDPASAIYHFERFLDLDPETDQEQLIKQHVDNCKMQLAQTYLIAPVVPAARTQLDLLKEEVKRLEKENDQLRWQMNALQANVDPIPGGEIEPGEPETKPEVAPEKPKRMAAAQRMADRPATLSTRIHTIKNGDYPAKIARRYNVKVEDILKANPGLNPRKLKIGTKVKVPLG